METVLNYVWIILGSLVVIYFITGVLTFKLCATKTQHSSIMTESEHNIDSNIYTSKISGASRIIIKGLSKKDFEVIDGENIISLDEYDTNNNFEIHT